MMVRNSGSLRLSVTAAEDSTPVSPVFTRARRTQTVRYRRRSRRQGPSISQLVPVLLEGTRAVSLLSLLTLLVGSFDP